MSYSLAVRIQFTFEISNKMLACLLTRNAKFNIDTVGISVIEPQGRFCDKLVNIVVGTVNPSDSDNERQIHCFRENLCHLCIKFKETCIIQVFNIETVTPSAGAYRIPFVNLICCGIDVIASYLGKPIPGQIVSTFFQVPQSQLQKAINIINGINTNAPDCNLCINVNNVDCVCGCKEKQKCPSKCNKKDCKEEKCCEVKCCEKKVKCCKEDKKDCCEKKIKCCKEEKKDCCEKKIKCCKEEKKDCCEIDKCCEKKKIKCCNEDKEDCCEKKINKCCKEDKKDCCEEKSHAKCNLCDKCHECEKGGNNDDDLVTQES